jgi:hypothetical protein
VEVAHPKLHFPKNFNLSDAPIFLLKSSQSLKSNKDFTGTIRLECEGYIKSIKRHEHAILFPNRGPEVMDYAKSYMAWQLSKFIASLDAKEVNFQTNEGNL